MTDRCRFLLLSFSLFFSSFVISAQEKQMDSVLKLNELGYYEIPGLNVMVFDDFYPEGHQGGLSIIQFGKRVASNGDIRLGPTPGQWSPVPKMGKRFIDKENGIIKVELWYPDSSKDKKGFNPIDYPDIKFKYTITTRAIGKSIKVTVDLNEPLPDEWIGKVGFNLELFPGQLFGEHYLMDGKPGLFPLQANTPLEIEKDGNLVPTPLTVGKQLIIAPANDEKEITIISSKSELQ